MGGSFAAMKLVLRGNQCRFGFHLGEGGQDMEGYLREADMGGSGSYLEP